MVSNYADFLVNLIDDLYRKVLTSGFYQNSFLKYIAFEQPEELESYLALHSDVSAEAFKLRCLEDTHSNFTQTERWENEYVTIKEVKIQYDSYHHDYIKAGRELRDLLYKARSLKKLVELLKENNIEWEANEQAINSLAEVIHIQSDKYPWLANTL